MILTIIIIIYIKDFINACLLIFRCLKSCPEKWQPELFTAISCHFIFIMDNKHDLGEIEFLLKSLNECCDKFPEVVFNCRGRVIEFLEHHLQNSYSLLV